jgi:5,10-methylenetetrahydromethanopterin reductase
LSLKKGGKMKFGIELVPSIKYYELEYYTKIAEDNRFDFVWLTDHYNNRNVYSMLTLLALKTRTIKMGAGVVNPYHIHPAVIASAIATVNEVSGGRAVLGIAAGDKVTLERIGISWKKPLTRLKEAVEIIRSLHSGKPVTFAGNFFRLSNAKLEFKPGNIPIYIGAQGPKMLQLAAKIGDGALINASHPKDFEEAKKNIDVGLDEVGKARFDTVAYTSTSVDRDREKARNAAKIVVAFIVAGSPDLIFERHSLDEKSVEKVRDALNAAFTKGEWAEVPKAVNDEMIDVFSITGTPDDVMDRVERLLKAGVTQVVAGSPIGPNKKKAIELLGKEVIPKFLDF